MNVLLCLLLRFPPFRWWATAGLERTVVPVVTKPARLVLWLLTMIRRAIFRGCEACAKCEGAGLLVSYPEAWMGYPDEIIAECWECRGSGFIRPKSDPPPLKPVGGPYR